MSNTVRLIHRLANEIFNRLGIAEEQVFVDANNQNLRRRLDILGCFSSEAGEGGVAQSFLLLERCGCEPGDQGLGVRGLLLKPGTTKFVAVTATSAFTSSGWT